MHHAIIDTGSAMPRLTAYISIGSTYSYLTVMRLPALAAARGVAVTWRAFNIRAILAEQGYTPFADKPAKLAYMWRDLERRAGETGVPWAGPAPYPVAKLERANAVAALAEREGWLAEYLQAAYERWFLHGESPGEEPGLAAALSACRQDPARARAFADGPQGAAALAAATEAAKARGVFGAPLLFAGDEPFWGDDRVEQALATAVKQG
ncbi:MAG: DsbA family protein [Caulobacterales bacterium]|nr:DsbA family protein [Caulobacterales bacterium]